MSSGTDQRDYAWPCVEPLQAIAELNEQCLELVVEQAALTVSAAPALLRELTALWSALDGASRKRAAACPFALIDVGFTEPQRWRWVTGRQVTDREMPVFAPFFTVPQAATLAQHLFTQAWYLARSQPIGAALYLGMPPECVALFKTCSLRQITEVAARYQHWLRPRWAVDLGFWRDLLEAALADEGLALERARLHGVQLLATELRTLEQVGRGRR
ncbi:MAG: hypothetical protein JOZ12_12560 [Sinobacteraceae bacterium]|nr:hypothetical protein [Nevskiaceae bacterium]